MSGNDHEKVEVMGLLHLSSVQNHPSGIAFTQFISYKNDTGVMRWCRWQACREARQQIPPLTRNMQAKRGSHCLWDTLLLLPTLLQLLSILTLALGRTQVSQMGSPVHSIAKALGRDDLIPSRQPSRGKFTYSQLRPSWDDGRNIPRFVLLVVINTAADKLDRVI